MESGYLVFFCSKTEGEAGMKQLKKQIVALMILTLIIGALAGCGNGEKTKENSSALSLYVGGTIFDSSLDPVKGAMSYGYPFTNNALTKVSPDSKYVGDLAKNWKISDDALTYTFNLRKSVKFHDGSDFTAEDVVFTYETVKRNQGDNAAVDLSRLESVTADSDYSVTFKLSEPYSSFLDQTACLGIVPSDGYDSQAFDKKPVGTGPWKVAQYDTDQKIIVTANSEYYDGAPAIPQVTILNMEGDTAIANAKSGQMDVVMVDPNYAEETVDGMHIENLETMDIRQISLPVTKENLYTTEDGQKITVGNNITSDKSVREALDIGIDRQKIIDNALNGIGKPANGFTSNLEWGNAAQFEDNKKQEAAALLEDAGWKKGKDGIYEKHGQKCQFTICSPTGDTARYQLGIAFAQEAKEIGVQIDVEQKTWDELYQTAASVGIVWGWGQYDPVVLKNLFYSKDFKGTGTDNTVGYSNQEADKAIEAAIDANNHADAVAAWKKVQEVTADDHAYLYIVNIEHSYFVSDGLDISVNTQIPHPHGHGAPVLCNMKDWTLK